MNSLQLLFEAHGARATREGDWLIVDEGWLRIQALEARCMERAGSVAVQIDFITETDSGAQIVESMVGIGPDRRAALADALYSFQEVVFHALIEALLERPTAHAHVEKWDVGGRLRTVTMGQLGTRGEFPHEPWPQTFKAIQAQLQGSDLPPGLHWVRYFYRQAPACAPVIEVLLDNAPWPLLQQEAAGLPWPKGDQFYSVRLFFIFKDASSP